MPEEAREIEIRFPGWDVDEYQVTVSLTPAQFDVLVTEHVIWEHEGTWNFEEDRLLDDDPDPFDADQVVDLADALLGLPMASQGEYSDAEALNLINYCLSAPNWSASFLEDILDIVNHTPRGSVRGAKWRSH